MEGTADIHTHKCTSSSSIHHIRYRCWAATSCDDVTAESGVLQGWLIRALHSGLSITASVQLVIPLRSRLMRSQQGSGAPPGGLLLPLGQYLISCLWGRSVGILHTWPNQWRHLCLSWSSTGNTPVLSRMSVFLTLFHKVIPKMFRRHLIWKDFSLQMSCWVNVHVLALYRSIGITRVW